MMIITFYLLLLAGFFYLFVRYLFWWFLPFLCALGASFVLEPAVSFCERNLRLRRGGAALFVLISLFLGAGSLFFLLLRRAWLELSHLIRALPTWGEIISGRLQIILTALIEQCDALGIPHVFSQDLYSMAFSLLGRLSSFFPGLISSLFFGIKNVGAALPQSFLFLAAFLLSCYFLCKDHKKIKQAVYGSIPHRLQPFSHHVRAHFISTLSSYCKTQLLLLTITFFELLLGLSIAQVDCVVLSAVCIAFVDLIPFIGTGFVLLPWSLYAWLGGDGRTALILLILYLCIMLVRQLTEPQIISQSIGMYPVATLMSLYAGFHAAGFWGMLFGPLCLILVQFAFTEYKCFYKRKKPLS
jgi:sporulation integral membrane protein YtvI